MSDNFSIQNWKDKHFSRLLNEDMQGGDLVSKLTMFSKALGADIADPLIQHAIKTSAESNDPNELLTIMADTMGTGDPDPFDGVFAQSDIENAIRSSKLPQDIGDMITDDDRIRNLELG